MGFRAVSTPLTLLRSQRHPSLVFSELCLLRQSIQGLDSRDGLQFVIKSGRASRPYCCCGRRSSLLSSSLSSSSDIWSPGNRQTSENKKYLEGSRQQLRAAHRPRITVHSTTATGEQVAPGKRSKESANKSGAAAIGSFASNSGDWLQPTLSDSSRRLIEANETFERNLRLSARNHRQSDHYDYSLFGLNPDLDRAVGRHQREAMLYNKDRHLKDEQAKLVAPNMRQSPIAIMNMNPTYELQNKPLIIEYPATVENLRLNNTGFSWEVKIPYQISMTTALYGAHLNTAYRYRLDQFHCHWGLNDSQGSEHTVDNRQYSAEIHFVHYNMEKYHTLSKAARHPDGLVVLSCFLDAQEQHHNHAELEKIVTHLKAVQLKGEHAIIKQAVRIENLLPANKSYWSYQGSLTTPPYFESVTWFILKHPIKCSSSQIQKFRNLKSALRHVEEEEEEDGEDGSSNIRSNHRKTQPLNGRTIVNYDEGAPQGLSTSFSTPSSTSRPLQPLSRL